MNPSRHSIPAPGNSAKKTLQRIGSKVMRKRITRLRRKLISFFIATTVVMIGLVTFGITPAMAAPALGSGEMCMFDAPNGAPIAAGYAAGHVGWGFEIGSSGRWTYGSTETGDGNPSGTWIQSGSETNMRAAFKAARGGRYYTQFRCHATPDSSVGAATTQANATKYNGYNGLFNNCLTKAISIYTAYWKQELVELHGQRHLRPPAEFSNFRNRNHRPWRFGAPLRGQRGHHPQTPRSGIHQPPPPHLGPAAILFFLRVLGRPALPLRAALQCGQLRADR